MKNLSKKTWHTLGFFFFLCLGSVGAGLSDAVVSALSFGAYELPYFIFGVTWFFGFNSILSREAYDEWRLIDSAPEDETSVVLYAKDKGDMFYMDYGYRSFGKYYHNGEPLGFAPTHWKYQEIPKQKG